MHLEQKQKDYNWYYAQCFTRNNSTEYGLGTQYTVVFAKTPTEAKKIVLEHFSSKLGNGDSLTEADVHLYQKNYIRQSRRMVASGNYCGVKPF